MRKSLNWLVFALAASWFCLACRTAEAQAAGWMIQQVSPMFGEMVIYVSPQGVRTVTPKLGLATIGTAPEWKFTVFNEKTKSYYTPGPTGRKQSLAGRLVRGASGVIAGHPATQYVMSGSPKKEEIWTAGDISVPPQLVQLFARTYKLPLGTGLPLRICYTNTEGKRVTALDTVRCQRITVPTATFKAPQGYRQVMDEFSLVLGDDESGDDILNQLDDPSLKADLDKLLKGR